MRSEEEIKAKFVWYADKVRGQDNADLSYSAGYEYGQYAAIEWVLNNDRKT